MKNLSPEFIAALDAYVKKCQDCIDQHHISMGYVAQNASRHKLVSEVGRRYVKIVDDGSAYSFVDITNGSILKAASWKSPARNFARGNIFSLDAVRVHPYGAY